MADTKISALTALTGANLADADLLPIVDVSDTTMAASGTDKSMTTLEAAKGIGLNGRLILDGSAPSAPSSGVALFLRTIANRNLPAFVGPSGLDSALQPFIARNAVQFFRAFAGLTTLTGVGMTVTATGTATAVTCASTNLATSVGAVENAVTVAATTAVAGFRIGTAAATLNLWRGNATGLGGFTFVCRFRAMRAWPSTQRCFVGVANSTAAPTDVEASSQINMLGVGYDAADANWQIMYNDGTGTATKASTSIARSSSDNQLLELIIFCKPNDSTVYFQFSELVAGTTFSTSTTTDIPATTLFMTPRGYRSVGGTSSTIGFGIVSIYVETDN